MNKFNLKKIFLKSITFTALYTIAIIAIGHFRDKIEIKTIVSERWYEFILLFFVMMGFNYYFDKKSKNNNKNKFYKDL
ncbi:MAG: hypothetical protein ABFR62_01905 [Bacteroidota bacterium]